VVGRAVGLTVAVDWSGDARAEAVPHPKLWIAHAADGELLSLAATSRRGAVAEILRAAERHGDELVAGLDFSFAYPAWFMAEIGCATGPELWDRTDGLDATRPPFYGAKGTIAPAADRRYRVTERRLREQGLRCGSTFQVQGPGSVGTGTLRGLPHLAALARAGLRVWPFDARPGPVVAEVYPRMFTGPVVKSRADARAAAWAGAAIAAPRHLARVAQASEDAFDAALTAAVLSRGRPWCSGELPAIAAVEGWALGA
jgi:hypothetical protein